MSSIWIMRKHKYMQLSLCGMTPIHSFVLWPLYQDIARACSLTAVCSVAVIVLHKCHDIGFCDVVNGETLPLLSKLLLILL